MTIPRIAPYPLPSESALPENRLRFRLDPTSAALLVHDVQDYFLDFYDRAASPVSPMLENVRALMSAARGHGIPIIYTAQPPEQSGEERGLLSDMWGPGITTAPLRCAIAQELEPSPSDIVLTKYRYSAFQRTDLAERLRVLGRTQLIVTGLYAHIGCLLSTADAFMRDIKPFFVADALADFSREHHERALFHVASCTGTVIATRALLELMRSKTDARETDVDIELAREIATLLEVEPSELSPDTNLLDLGLDSLRIMTLVEQFRARGLDVTFVDLAETPTLKHYTSLSARRAGA